jgi:hypothetical protein
VTNCGQTRIGTLDHSLYEGTCFATETHIGLCFDASEKRLCRRGTDPLGQFQAIENSNYDHYVIGWMSASNSKNYSNDLILVFSSCLCTGKLFSKSCLFGNVKFIYLVVGNSGDLPIQQFHQISCQFDSQYSLYRFWRNRRILCSNNCGVRLRVK